MMTPTMISTMAPDAPVQAGDGPALGPPHGDHLGPRHPQHPPLRRQQRRLLRPRQHARYNQFLQFLLFNILAIFMILITHE